LTVTGTDFWYNFFGQHEFRVQQMRLRAIKLIGSLALLSVANTGLCANPKSSAAPVDFNREIRPILTENCFKCHGPDDGARKAKLRFDIRTEALKPAKSGELPIVPGAPEKSEMIARVTASDPDDRMPPIKSGKSLTPMQVETLKRWIAEGAKYAVHWAYVKPQRPPLPSISDHRWPLNAIDHFILARLEDEHLRPSPQADRHTLIRRVSLDLTGLPPTPEEVSAFVTDSDPKAYEKLVDRLLQKDAFGEHWARLWLDLARYADSAGYADDPPRIIWLFRDYVIKALNANKPFDRFTIEQIAGDLLPDATEEDREATAFHRNTMTNNEGGTDDEEFRNAAVVDRVNTTMSVWMATSMGCAQCHNHKYDPLSQHDYFSMFAIFNNTEDADLNDERPLLQVFSTKDKELRSKWHDEIAAIEDKFKTTTPESLATQAAWEKGFSGEHRWMPAVPSHLTAKEGGLIEPTKDGGVKLTAQQRAEVYTMEVAAPVSRISALRIEALPSSEKAESGQELNRGYSITHVAAKLLPSSNNVPIGRYVRVELPGKEKILSLAEVQILSNGENIARDGEASQSSVAYEGEAKRAIDGNTNGDYENGKSTTHTEASENPWWEVDLKKSQPIEKIVIWNRTDNNLEGRLSNFRLIVLDEKREEVWRKDVNDAPKPSSAFALDGVSEITFGAVYSDSLRPDPDLKSIIAEKGDKKGGWRVQPEDKHYLTLVPAKPLLVRRGARMQLSIEQFAQRVRPPAAELRIEISDDQRISEYAKVPEPILQILNRKSDERTEQQRSELSLYYRSNIESALQPDREKLKKLNKQVAELKPDTVPVMRELTGAKRRKTHIQFRGNFQALGDEVTEAVPVAFQPLPAGAKPDRLALAHWLVDKENPLTARVLANRLWEQIFGVGIVRTSDDFGSQGDRPTNPELLDWLACQLRDGGDYTASLQHSIPPWDIKAFLKLIVTSATYRQSSRVTPELQERDPDNLLLARGPRFRMPAEVIRDQALAVSGLLSRKMYGPSVRPPQPALGLTAAFGGSLDWKASTGEDRYRRALYVEWRRTSPYPSMATFDAPNREVCALRRPRSNTPLQALVTLNDPVYVEAAQALGKRMASATGSVQDKVRDGFELCLARPPKAAEMNRLVELYQGARADYAKQPDKAKEMAGPSEKNDVAELAAWTTVANVLLNLDEFLMRP
jgi:hypothetical protein